MILGAVLAGGSWRQRAAGAVIGGTLALIGKAIAEDIPPFNDWNSPIAFVRDSERVYKPPRPIPFRLAR